MSGRKEHFFKAIENGDTAEAAALFEQDSALVHEVDEQGATALFYGPSFEMMNLLYRYGADLNARDNHGNTPLHDQVGRGSTKTVEFLVSHGADINVTNDKGETPLKFALEDEDPDGLYIANLLVNAGAEIRHADEAAALGNTAWFKTFVKDNPEDINAEDRYGRTPLFWAIHYDRPEIADLLRQHGAKE